MHNVSSAPFGLLDSELEAEYRAFRSRDEAQWLTVAAIAGVVGVLGFIGADRQLVESDSIVRALLVARIVVVGLIVQIYFVRRATTDYRIRDVSSMVALFSIVALDFGAELSRPVGFTGNFALLPILVLLVYVVVPGPPRALMAAAILFSIGCITAGAVNQVNVWVHLSLVAALILANWVGFVALSRISRQGREQFLIRRSLQDTNDSLQDALAEIRVLREIVPLCAACKRVRDDHGYWENVEDYISRHTGSSVSHGMCPQCYKDLYGVDAG